VFRFMNYSVRLVSVQSVHFKWMYMFDILMLFNIRDSGTVELNLRTTMLKVELENCRLHFEL